MKQKDYGTERICSVDFETIQEDYFSVVVNTIVFFSPLHP